MVERPHHIYAVDLEREDGEIWGLHFGKTETSYNIRMVDASGAAAREADRLPPGAEIVKIRSDDDEHFIKTDEFAAEDFQKILVNSYVPISVAQRIFELTHSFSSIFKKSTRAEDSG